ncbi:MAG: hypothetical protein NTZ08_06195 [Verrucomicrobia bacterium]|jgi:hypothetical protein|nr:hypothetical protein [Verrucomicrobiota bacterium]
MSDTLIFCSKCGQSKPVAFFYVRKETGRPKPSCKECISKRGSSYRALNKDVIASRNKAWVQRNAKKIREQHQIYRSTVTGAWTAFVSRKRKGKHSFSINKADFIAWWTKTEKVCAYCGINKEQQQLVFERMGRSVRDVELQIDRKDSSQGYSIENICFACRVCNEHKRDFFSYEQFQRIAKRFVQPKMAFLLGGKTSAKAL